MGSPETETQNNSKKFWQIYAFNKDIAWFIGFSEGDGSFARDFPKKRISFVITQKDPKVLYKIRKLLGFGVVRLCKDTYYRYIVSKNENLVKLIHIFNGNLVLDKTNERYKEWLELYNSKAETKINLKLKKESKLLSINSPWLTGFIDAEGCFDAPLRNKRKTFRMRFSIKQKGEKQIMSLLPHLFCKNKKTGHIYQKKDITIFTMDSFVSLKYLNIYLSKYPLKSNKKIAYMKWLKLYRVLEDGGRGKSFDTIEKMSKNINKYWRKEFDQRIEDTVRPLEKN